MLQQYYNDTKTWCTSYTSSRDSEFKIDFLGEKIVYRKIMYRIKIIDLTEYFRWHEIKFSIGSILFETFLKNWKSQDYIFVVTIIHFFQKIRKLFIQSKSNAQIQKFFTGSRIFTRREIFLNINLNGNFESLLHFWLFDSTMRKVLHLNIFKRFKTTSFFLTRVFWSLESVPRFLRTACFLYAHIALSHLSLEIHTANHSMRESTVMDEAET